MRAGQLWPDTKLEAAWSISREVKAQPQIALAYVFFGEFTSKAITTSK